VFVQILNLLTLVSSTLLHVAASVSTNVRIVQRIERGVNYFSTCT